MLDRTTLWVVAALIAVQLVLWAGARLLQAGFEDSEVAFLAESDGATWLRTPNPDAPSTYGAAGFRAAYRKRFVVDEVPESALLRFRPFRWVIVYLDGRQLFRTNRDQDLWKREYTLELAPILTPGPHELVLSVRNRAGPPLVLASSDALGFQTDETWEAMNDETGGWVPAATIGDPQENSVAGKLPTVPVAFTRALPWLSLPFLLGITWALARERSTVWRRRTPTASGLRWLLLTAWALLAANNITKVPYHVGFDVNGHFEYILFILRNGSIPLATDGWAMFQSPLYHLISAPLYAVFTAMFSSVQVVEALRIVPLFCGAMQVQLCYLATREVFPDREDLQALGTLLGGLLPMNLYMSQNLGNEPLVGMLSQRRDRRRPAAPARIRSGRWSPRLFVRYWERIAGARPAREAHRTPALRTGGTRGGACGRLLRLPAKRHGRSRRFSRPRAHSRWRWSSVTAFLVCGWYYVRNWVHLGKPFIGGWDPARVDTSGGRSPAIARSSSSSPSASRSYARPTAPSTACGTASTRRSGSTGS